MTAVLERSELEASPLADLHAIADQIGLDGFRRLRKADLIDAIVDRAGGDGGSGKGASGGRDADTRDGDGDAAESPGERESTATRRRRPSRSRRAKASEEESSVEADERDEAGVRDGVAARDGAGARDGAAARGEDAESDAPKRRAPRSRRARTTASDAAEQDTGARGRSRAGSEGGERTGGRSRDSAASSEREEGGAGRSGERVVEGVVELLGNGSAFLRVSPPDASDEDAYISAAQVRRCELVSGDRVSGPVRTPRNSERYSSLARVDTINGASADSVAEGSRYEDLPVSYPSERLELDSEDSTLGAIEWLTPIGRGSRAVIVGSSRAGKTETLRRLLGALSGREDLEVVVVLSGVRPEEIAAWSEGSATTPAAALSFAASAERQGQTVEHVVETARRIATRGGNVVVLIDSLDGLHPHTARKVLANARNLTDGGSLTLIATATRPFGGESTVIALDVALASTGRLPALDLAASGTVRPELLVGEDGAAAITKARAAALGG